MSSKGQPSGESDAKYGPTGTSSGQQPPHRGVHSRMLALFMLFVLPLLLTGLCPFISTEKESEREIV